MLELIAKTEIENAIPVELFRTNFGYAVRYGLEIKKHMSAELARVEYTAMINHALLCAHVYDN